MGTVRKVRIGAAVMVVAGMLTAAGSQVALGATPGFSQLFLNGQVVGTVVPPAEVDPGTGRDPFYKVTNGATGQLGIAGVGPGEPGYHGGDWQVWAVTFNSGVRPYLLKSGSDVATAKGKGDVTVVRHAAQEAQDFRCPITSTAVG